MIFSYLFFSDVNVLPSFQQGEYLLPLLTIKFYNRHFVGLYQMSTEPNIFLGQISLRG